MTDPRPDDVSAAAKRWAALFESLTPARLAELDRLCAPGVRFKDPFNDVVGVEKLRRVFVHMFETVDDPVFSVSDIAVSGQTAYLRWEFSFRPKGRKAGWTISGMSEVVFDGAMRVAAHIDHWDASEQFYARLPVLGTLIRLARSRLRAG